MSAVVPRNSLFLLPEEIIDNVVSCLDNQSASVLDGLGMRCKNIENKSIYRVSDQIKRVRGLPAWKEREFCQEHLIPKIVRAAFQASNIYLYQCPTTDFGSIRIWNQEWEDHGHYEIDITRLKWPITRVTDFSSERIIFQIKTRRAPVEYGFFEIFIEHTESWWEYANRGLLNKTCLTRENNWRRDLQIPSPSFVVGNGKNFSDFFGRFPNQRLLTDLLRNRDPDLELTTGEVVPSSCVIS